MNGQSQFRRIYEIVAVAIELTVEDREGDLDQAFRGAGALWREVEFLLAVGESAIDFLGDPSIHAAEAFTAQIELNEGEIVDGFSILEKIAKVFDAGATGRP